MTVSAAESDKHQLESRRWQTCRKTGSLQTSPHLPMLALTVLGPFWFNVGGAKPRDMDFHLSDRTCDPHQGSSQLGHRFLCKLHALFQSPHAFAR